MQLIINADDLGYSPHRDAAILKIKTFIWSFHQAVERELPQSSKILEIRGTNIRYGLLAGQPVALNQNELFKYEHL